MANQTRRGFVQMLSVLASAFAGGRLLFQKAGAQHRHDYYNAWISTARSGDWSEPNTWARGDNLGYHSDLLPDRFRHV